MEGGSVDESRAVSGCIEKEVGVLAHCMIVDVLQLSEIANGEPWLPEPLVVLLQCSVRFCRAEIGTVRTAPSRSTVDRGAPDGVLWQTALCSHPANGVVVFCGATVVVHRMRLCGK